MFHNFHDMFDKKGFTVLPLRGVELSINFGEKIKNFDHDDQNVTALNLK